MRWFILTLCLLLLSSTVASAQDSVTPIITLNDGGIYAVSPLDGNVQTLVAPPDDYAELNELSYEPVTLFSTEWLSPDGQFLAYRTLRGDALDTTQSSEIVIPHALFVLDVQNVGDPIPVRLLNDAQPRTNIYVESVAWSADGQRLYAAITVDSPGAPGQSGWWLVYVERGAWDAPVVVPLRDPERGLSRRIFAASDGMVVMDTAVQVTRYAFSLYNSNGRQVSQFDIDWTSVTDDVNLYLNTPFTPLLVKDTLRYALVRQAGNELAYLADFDTGAITPYEYGYFPAVVSVLAPETSLRVSAGYFDGDSLALLARDAEGHIIGNTDIFSAYAFGIAGDSSGSTYALSPDGQSIAYLQHGALMLWQNGETTALDVTAQVIAWSPTRNIAIYDPLFMMG